MADHLTEDRQKIWDAHYARGGADSITYDDWYSRHLSALAPGSPILELGCGMGFVSETLHLRGYAVTATDIAPTALARLQARVPGIVTHRVDLENPLPFPDSSFSAVVADLCLHYFPAEVTAGVVSEIGRVLVPGGKLLARVNSTLDVNHGAGEGEQIETGFYCRNGHYKRFFDVAMIESFFSSWRIDRLDQYEVHRHENPKQLIELIATRPQDHCGAPDKV